MKTTRIVALFLALAFSTTVFAGTKVSQMRRTATVLSNDLFMLVRTVDGKKTNYAIEARYLGPGLGSWITNAGGGSGEVSTAQLNAASNTLFQFTLTTSNYLYGFIGSGGGEVTTIQLLAASNYLWSASSVASNALYTSIHVSSNALNSQISSASNTVLNLAGLYKSVTYVNATGTTAIINGRLLTNTIQNASASTLVVVGPGNYQFTNTTPGVMKDRVDVYWMPQSHLMVQGVTGEEASIINDSDGPVTIRWFGHGWFSITNDLAYALNLSGGGSDVVVEYEILEAGGAGGTTSAFTIGANTKLRLVGRDYTYTSTYDAGFGVGTGSKLHWTCPRVYTGQDLFEFTDFDNWGDCYINIDYALKTNSGTAFQLGGRQIVRVGWYDMWANSYGLSFLSSSTNGYLFDSILAAHQTNTIPVIGAPAVPAMGRTDLWMKNCTVYGPTNADPISVSNGPNRSLVLENCTIIPGWNATNWARALTIPASVDIRGFLDSNLREGANITIVGRTNRYGGRILADIFHGSFGLFDEITSPSATIDSLTTSDFFLNGSGIVSGDLTVAGEAYGAGWNGSSEVPTKNDVYDKIEALSGVGEVNVNGEISITNATKIGLVYGKAGVTNLLRSLQAGNGIVKTNQGTNIVTAIDPAIVASQANITALSNAVVAQIPTTHVTASSTFGTDNRIIRSDGTGRGAQSTGITVDDSDRVAFPAGVLFQAPSTNNQEAYFQTDIFQTAGETANLGLINASGAATFASTIITPSTITANQVVASNGVVLYEKPLTQSGTNLVADGSLSGSFSNNITANVGGVTNVLFINMVDGVTYDLWLSISPGVTVQLPQFASGTNWTGGRVPTFPTNTVPVWIKATRRGVITNATVFQTEYVLRKGPGVLFDTNFVTGEITAMLDGTLTNLIGTVGNNVTNENSGSLQINSGTLSITPGALSNLVNNTSINFQPGNSISNLGGLLYLVHTPAITTSNLLLNTATNRHHVIGCTNAIFTNLVELATGQSADLTVYVQNTTGVSMGLVWPAFGAQHGYYFSTNVYNDVRSKTSLASGARGMASFSFFGTNIVPTWTDW